MDVFCSGGFYSLSLVRLLFGIAAFGMLFAMCCSVCTGVRFYKHSVRLSQTGGIDEFGSPNRPEDSRNDMLGTKPAY